MDADVELIAVSCRFALAAAFLVAALGKLGRPREFERAVRGYGLVPPAAASLIARALPPLELGCAALLVAGLALPAVATALAVLLAAFTFAVAFNLMRGRRIDCGCFGAGIPRTIGWGAVGRNLVLGAMAICVAAAAPRALALDAIVFGPAGGLSHSNAVAVLVTTAALLLAASLLRESIRLRARLGDVERIAA